MQPLTAFAHVARGQYGLGTLRQARAASMTDRQVECAVETGALERVHREVFRFAAAPRSWEQAAMAACLAAGSGAVLSHRSAARLWGLVDADARDGIELSVPYPSKREVPGVVVHRVAELGAGSRLTTRRHRIPVTNPMLTLLNISGQLPAHLVEDALDRGLVARLYSVAAVERVRADIGKRGRPGSAALGRILDERALGRDRPDSLLEPRMAQALKRHALPRPVFQHRLKFPGHRPIKVDFCYVVVRLAIEVLGFNPHGGWRRAQIDIERRNLLELFGYHLLEFTWNQVVRRPAYVGDIIRATLVRLGCDEVVG